MYSAAGDGEATDWHLAHYVGRAVGGAGLLLLEATAVQPGGRISTEDLGLWADEQIAPLARVVRGIQEAGAAAGVQLGHAGRKAWSRKRGYGPQVPVAPSPVAFAENWQMPQELTAAQIEEVVQAWQAAARRALDAGFDVIEIHAAHGYLIHQFLSPISNSRRDQYGGTLAHRMRFLLQVTDAVRQVWPDDRPLFVRLSATDWVPPLPGPVPGLTPDDVVLVARELRERGVDVIDCSSGGSVPASLPAPGPGYQVPFATQVRQEAEIPTVAVGLISAPQLADEIVRNGRADLVALGRELLRHPYWPLEAAATLGYAIDWPVQYERARSS
jgi:2,4-dienoyl-CoA reductase-like NADH-dependent reductase (Old Yellow Enzyme family)